MTASNDTSPPDIPDDLGTIQTAQRTYQLIRKIGRGGCGNVYEAEAMLPLGLRRRLAIKFIADKYAGDKQMIARFAREARTGMRVTEASPNLVTTYDFGECPERGLFLVMQLIEGPKLSSVSKAIRGDLPLIWRIAWDVLAGLGHLHGHGLVHRDVSLANVLLAQDGMVKLADLGLTSCPDMPWDQPRLVGVPQYWAPELHLRLPATEKSDLFALGVMLYELITGEPPFGDERDEIFERMRTGPPPSLPDDVPDVGKQLVRGLLEMGEKQRPSLDSAIELLCDVPRADNGAIAELAAAWNSVASDSPEGTVVSRSSLELMRAVEAYNPPGAREVTGFAPPQSRALLPISRAGSWGATSAPGTTLPWFASQLVLFGVAGDLVHSLAVRGTREPSTKKRRPPKKTIRRFVSDLAFDLPTVIPMDEPFDADWYSGEEHNLAWIADALRDPNQAGHAAIAGPVIRDYQRVMFTLCRLAADMAEESCETDRQESTERAVRDAEHGDDVEQAASTAASTETPAAMTEDDVDVAIEAFEAVLAAQRVGTAHKPIVLLPTPGEQEQLPSSAREDAVDAASTIVDAYQTRAADKPIVFWPRAFDRASCSPSLEDDVNNAVEVVIAAHRAGKAHKPIVLGPRRGSVDRAASWVKRRAAPVAAFAVIAAACLMFFLTRGEQPNRAHAEVPPLPLASETIDICPPASPETTPAVDTVVAVPSTAIPDPAAPLIAEPAPTAEPTQPKRTTKRRPAQVKLHPGQGIRVDNGEDPPLTITTTESKSAKAAYTVVPQPGVAIEATTVSGMVLTLEWPQ